MTIEIPVGKKHIAVVDDIDADLAKLKWYYLNEYAGHRTLSGHEWLHRVILQRTINAALQKDQLCDHINGNKLDCRRSNLRIASHTENSRNQKRHSNSISPYKGASWNKKASKWQCLMRIDKRVVWLGDFDTALEAHRAYCIATLKHHAPFHNFGSNSPFVGWTLIDFERGFKQLELPFEVAS